MPKEADGHEGINMGDIRRRTACFTGHRIIEEPSEAFQRKLTTVIETLIQNGYLYFGAGGARGFDALASETVLKLKTKYPNIYLILVLPFDEQYKFERDWKPEEIAQYHKIKTCASKVVVLAPDYSKGIYYRRNRHLVENSSVCVAYMIRKNSGTGYTVNYAKSQNLQVINIADWL